MDIICKKLHNSCSVMIHFGLVFFPLDIVCELIFRKRSKAGRKLEYLHYEFIKKKLKSDYLYIMMLGPKGYQALN